MMYRRIILLLIVLLLSCTDIFLPKTGMPTYSFLPRATPQGVVDQLIDGYESRRIELIQDLLADSFQFYVAPSFENYYESKYSYYEPETPDSTLDFITDKPYYYYWKRKDEIERTKMIFSNTLLVEFRVRPYISDLAYTITFDNDTTGIELRLVSGLLYLVTNGKGNQYVDVHNQVFLLRRGIDGLWQIRKWYDLSSEMSN